MGAPTAAPTAVPVVAPTPAPDNRRLRSRRLAVGDMLVVARFAETANVTLPEVQAASDDIRLEVNNALTDASVAVTVSSLMVSEPAPADAPTPAPAPTPKPDSPTSAAVISRLDLWASALALLLCSGRV